MTINMNTKREYISCTMYIAGIQSLCCCSSFTLLFFAIALLFSRGACLLKPIHNIHQHVIIAWCYVNVLVL